ncbi:type II secretion system F family protein [Actinomadura rubrisoli]|uniref:Type II secretion system F family protein n=1 Tax=Actinomadura rubrisoli TaxID=2530368 RepID=A0A4R5AH83_9ACTN|nr:type II secretion system F family protein [Actinomadura rubrisoli]TDD69422.1 type II secretion system F family protein [Actinomadura rubrisoli]
MLIAMAAGAAASVLLAAWGLVLATSGERVAASALDAPVERPRRRGALLGLNRIAEGAGRPFTGIAMNALAPWHRKIRERIDAAGRPGGMTVESYARTTAGYCVLFGSLSVLLLAGGQMLMGVISLAGAFQNEFLLLGRARSRRDEMQRSMPDFLDVLAVTVSAGMGFRHSLARVVESMPGPLADEFTVALRQMELGTPRREAFEDLRRRNRSEMVSQFVTAVLQAEELGAPLATALIDIATDMRRESAQWARRKAQRTAPQVTAVTTALTLPALIIVVIGALFFSSGADLGALFGG